MKEYIVDGTHLSIGETPEGFQVVGGRPKRVLISVSRDEADAAGPNGLMGLAWRHGLQTSTGRAFKLLSYLLKQDLDGSWHLKEGIQ